MNTDILTTSGGTAPGGMALASICGHLIRRSQQVHNAIWLDEFGTELTSPQYGLLAALASRPGIDQRQAGELASLDKSSAADVIARLARKMWISYGRDARDARRKILHLSPAAVIALSHLTPLAERVQERLLQPLPNGRHPAFIMNLAHVARFDVNATSADDRSSRLALQLMVPGHLIRRAQQVHTAMFYQEFGGELSGPQYAVMHVLAQAPAIRQRELGEKAALDKATLTDIVRRLERRGWLARQQDPQDRRAQLLQLEPRGAEMVVDFAPRVASVQARLLSPLTAQAQRSLLSELATVAYAGDVPVSANLR